MTICLFSGDMSHGHSHGGHNKKSKNEKGNNKDEDSVEIGDSEHLCADEKIGIEENQGHSNESGLLTLDNGRTTNEDKKSKNKKKKGCKKTFENKHKN